MCGLCFRCDSGTAQVLLCLLIASCWIAGCSSSAEEGERAEATTGLRETALGIVYYTGSGDERRTNFVKTLNDPSPAEIEREVRALDWNDAQCVPWVGLGRRIQTKSPANTVNVTGLIGATHEADAARAKWIRFEHGRGVVRQSAPVESLDTVIELLVAASQNDDQKLQALIAWEVTESE